MNDEAMRVAIDDTRINQGGLMRCCIQSLHEWAIEQGGETRVPEGTEVPCGYCTTGGVMLVGMTWRWRQAPEITEAK